MDVKCYLKEQKHGKALHFDKNFAGFVKFYFALSLILVYSNIVRTYEMLLTYDFRIRNTDPRLLDSCLYDGCWLLAMASVGVLWVVGGFSPLGCWHRHPGVKTGVDHYDLNSELFNLNEAGN